MFCINCGASVPDDAKVCPECGNSALVASSVPDEEENVAESIDSGENTAEEENGSRDIYSTAARHVRQEPEMEDIYSGEQLNIPPLKFKNEQEQPRPVEEYRDMYSYDDEDEAPRKKRVWLVVVIIAAVLIAAAGAAIGIYSWYNSPTQQFGRAMDAKDYSKITLLLPQLEDSERELLSSELRTLAMQAVQQYNSSEAEYGVVYDLVDRLQRLYPDSQELKSAAEQMKALKASKESFASAVTAEKNGEVENALRLFAAVVDTDVNYDKAQEYITAIKADYKSGVIADAQKLAENKDFLGAAALLENSASVLGEDEDIESKKLEIQEMEAENYVTSTLEAAEKMANEDDLVGAAKLLEGAEKQDPRFDEQIKQYKQQYRDEKLEEAEKLAESSDYEGAVAVLEKAKSFIGEEETVNAKIKEYKALYPVLLIDIGHTGGSNCSSIWPAYGVNGTKYSNGLSFSMYPSVSETVSTEYTPGGKYKYLSGTWVVDSSTTEGFIGKLKVYVDGVAKYELSQLTLKSGTKDMNLLIGNAQKIRIEVEGAFTDPKQVGYIYLANATFKN